LIDDGNAAITASSSVVVDVLRKSLRELKRREEEGKREKKNEEQMHRREGKEERGIRRTDVKNVLIISRK
jgi:hypothetical protein